MKPVAIQIYLPEIQTSKKGSPPVRYQIYHSNDAEMVESFLIGEIDADQNKGTEKMLVFDYKNPRIAVPHFFKVAAINAMGEGPLSEATDMVLLG
jgi:hypothetical protein